MDVGFPALKSEPVVAPLSGTGDGTPAPCPLCEAGNVFTKSLFQRSAFRAWALGLAALASTFLTGKTSWEETWKAALAATITAAVSLLFGADSMGLHHT